MSNPTAARVKSSDEAHWYFTDGKACHVVDRADKKGQRSTNLKDARKLNLLPSVTGILKLLHKEALVNWMIEQAVLAVVTAPRQPGEADDVFITRVLQVEQQQHQERDIARDKGNQIHDAIEAGVVGLEIDAEIFPWVKDALEAIMAFGEVISTETGLVGDGYAGRCDLMQEFETHLSITDYKGSKTLPDPLKGGAWSEHRLQLAAYAKAWQLMRRAAGQPEKPIIRRNVYISTVNQGQFVICEHEEDLDEIYFGGFAPLVKHWQWVNGYKPAQQIEIEAFVNHASTQSAAQPVPAAAPLLPAPTNGPQRTRKTVVTEGIPTLVRGPNQPAAGPPAQGQPFFITPVRQAHVTPAAVAPQGVIQTTAKTVAEAALDKLTPEERQALGLEKDPRAAALAKLTPEERAALGL